MGRYTENVHCKDLEINGEAPTHQRRCDKNLKCKAASEAFDETKHRYSPLLYTHTPAGRDTNTDREKYLLPPALQPQ